MANYRMKCETGIIGVEQTKAPPPIELNIKLYWDGKLQITGPLQDKDFCLRMLESAKEQLLSSDSSQLVSSN